MAQYLITSFMNCVYVATFKCPVNIISSNLNKAVTLFCKILNFLLLADSEESFHFLNIKIFIM